jgi:Rrf2 family protein
MLDGSRGIGGGYRLARDPRTIRLIDVVELFEGVRTSGACLLGRIGGCEENNPCSAHQEWARVRKIYETFLTTRTIADLSGESPTEAS